jgi:glutamyl/glutaminyl-tRNA synthetase
VPDQRDVAFEDAVRGRVVVSTEVIGDPVLMRSDRTPAYNFAVVIDDALMGITQVIRGEDHISNTPRQAPITRRSGGRRPLAHLSLVLGPITPRCRSVTARRRSPSFAARVTCRRRS